MVSSTLGAISYTARVKTYPDGSQSVLACSAPIFGRGGWEERDRWEKRKRKPREPPPEGSAAEPGSADRAARRARARLRDLALCSDLSYFVTFTLDPGKVDRHDVEAMTKRLNTWLDNRVRRKGLAYILVPEYHKRDPRAIHYHGLINEALPVVDSGTMTGAGLKKPRRPRSARERAEWEAMGRVPVYNLPDWDFGFTTAIRLYGDRHKAVGYVCKYIGKDAVKVGGRYFYHGGDLREPVVEYAPIDFRDLEQEPGAYIFDVPEAGLMFAQVFYPGENLTQMREIADMC